MKYLLLLITLLAGLCIHSCTLEEEPTSTTREIPVPDTYTFLRNGLTTVSFPNQTIRVAMSMELINALLDFDQMSKAHLLEMYHNTTAAGLDANPFDTDFLNRSILNIRQKVASSLDYFSDNLNESELFKELLESWILAQAEEVLPQVKRTASYGKAGVLPDGLFPRYVNNKGMEYRELVLNSLMGALMTDQALNKYLSAAWLDLEDSREANDNLIFRPGTNYTNMEHEWDEAYGYVYCLSRDIAEPNKTIGEDDEFLNYYVGSVNSDADFVGIADSIFHAFKYGRAAIVAREYDVRIQQADIIREKISEVIAINAVHFLQQGKLAINPDNPNYGSAFHYLSKAYGAIFSLRFTRNPQTEEPYFSKVEVDSFLTDIFDDGPNGFWDVQISTLDNLSEAIASRFSFTVEEARDR